MKRPYCKYVHVSKGFWQDDIILICMHTVDMMLYVCMHTVENLHSSVPDSHQNEDFLYQGAQIRKLDLDI